MVGDNYSKILERIARSSGLEKEEIQRRVEAKRAKLSGLISLEGAAQVVAAELGISFEGEKLKLDELLPGMRKVNVSGKIIRLFPVRSFTSKKGEEGKVANLILADDTSNIKVVLWDTHHIELIENSKIAEGSSVEIVNGSMRDNEIHLGSFSEFKPSEEVFENVKTERIVKEKTISELKIGDSVRVRAFVVQSFEPRFFSVCIECKKKAVQEGDNFVCSEHGKVAAEKRALINIVLDDGTETFRAVLFSERLPEIGITELDNTNLLLQQRQNLLGKEMDFFGSIRMNKFFNNPEFIVDKVQEINMDELLKSLEN